ncbi:3-deoxy-D-manno-octulosonic acid transferase [Phaeovulum sp. W22_SRMD_FR3]|uniref:3-deoxy-D-manno-octulosonic acid transferase n=1 Tax=Phaeovulum sp. W22_SRMD_FR3 TaxID=3240274 RepID=UPI003F94CF7F
MARSAALWLHLLSRSRLFTGAAPARPGPASARREGPLIWLHASSPEALPSLLELGQRLRRLRPGLTLLASAAATPEVVLTRIAAAQPDAGLTPIAAPLETRPAMKAHLARWRPDLVVLVGSDLPPVLIAETHASRRPILLADAKIDRRISRRWSFRGEIERAVLKQFKALYVQDQPCATALARMRLPAERVSVMGRISPVTDPLGATEAERAALAELLRTRPVWLAMAVPEAEEEAVLAAHEHALRHAHRILLILIPETQDRAAPLAAELRAKGWDIARRWADEEPEEDVQILIADDPGEFGLWYRLAPVSWMGGTLHPGPRPAPGSAQFATREAPQPGSLALPPAPLPAETAEAPPGRGRSPLEPAALGSAILHGPGTEAHPMAYGRLTEARAARAIATPQALADAVADLIAVDKAAMLAHNAWAVTSGGAGVATAIAKAILSELDKSGRGQTPTEEPLPHPAPMPPASHQRGRAA